MVAQKRIWDVESVLKDKSLGFLFVLPSLLILAVLIGGALVYALYLSFNDLVIAGGQVTYEFKGLSNYLHFLDDTRLHQTLIQTVVYTFFRVSSIVVISLTLAMLLNQAVRGVGILKRLFLIPWALSYVVNALVWGWIYNGNFGLLNEILLRLNVIDKYHVWLAEPPATLAAITFADVWKAVPFGALMLLAGLQGLPREIEDAAKVDGANAWDRFRHVTVPWLRPVLLVLLVIETMWALKTFDLIWVLTKGGPSDSTMVLNVYAYQQTFQFFKFGYGSAVGYLIAALILGLTLVYFYVLRGFEE